MGRKMILMLALFIVPTFSFGQYFQGLYDFDSSQDWGDDIILRPDGNYFVRGGGVIPSNNDQWARFDMQISSNGTMLSKKKLEYPNISMYSGFPGTLKMLPEGGYIAPVSLQSIYNSNVRGWAGLLKYDAAGDTIFMKTYTDTSVYFDVMAACAIMPDGGYILCGSHDYDTPSYYPGYIIRTDSLGDTQWTHTYRAFPAQYVQLYNVIPLADSRIVASGISYYIKNPGPNEYYCYTPWFMLLDSMGNIIKDTLYTSGFQSGGFIYKDMNGGYINMGNLDILYGGDPDALQSFPSYIAHLDTNFRVTWLTPFPYSDDTGNRDEWLVRQLMDSSYIILGDAWTNYGSGNYGWAAKISRNGEIIWSNTYMSDSTKPAAFNDMVELPNGNLVFAGMSFNDTLPAWHNLEDIWLVGTDSNGCYNPFCAALGVKPPPAPKGEFSLYPNPTGGNFTINAPQAGNISVCNIQGQQVAAYTITDGETNLRLPGGLAAGVYFVRYISEQGNNVPVVVRLIYAP